MELGHIAIRSLFAFAYLLYMLRVSGKRTIGQATPFDFVVSLILGDLIDDLLWADVPASQFVVAVATIGLLDVLIAVGCHRSPSFFQFVNGRVTLALRDGTLQGKELASEQMNDRDIEHLLNEQGISRQKWAEARLAILERDHQISVLKHEWAEDAQKKDRSTLRRVSS